MTARCRENSKQKNTKRVPETAKQKKIRKKKCPKAKKFSNDDNCYKENLGKLLELERNTKNIEFF